MLIIIYTILIASIFFLYFFNELELKKVKIFSLRASGLVLILTSLLTANFDTNQHFFQNVFTANFGSSFLNLNYTFGLDGISILFFFLSAFLIFICLLFIWEDPAFKNYAINLFLIELFLLVIFSTLDLFVFYVFFEAILVPMFLIIGVHGSRERKIRAVYLFFFYTLCGSILMLISILYIYVIAGTLNMEYLSS